jgi:hypothetical protein
MCLSFGRTICIFSFIEAMHLLPQSFVFASGLILLPRALAGTAATSSQLLFGVFESLPHLLPRQAFFVLPDGCSQPFLRRKKRARFYP